MGCRRGLSRTTAWLVPGSTGVLEGDVECGNEETEPDEGVACILQRKASGGKKQP